MAHVQGLADINGCSIKVGTTGTIGSLMTRELESMKHIQHTTGSSHKKHQTAPVSVPCGATPRKMQPIRNLPSEVGSSSSSNIGSTDVHKPRQTHRKNEHRMSVPNGDNITLDKMQNKDKPEKKGPSHIVEIVDLKCNNPMSSRLKKLGFSKLSESII